MKRPHLIAYLAALGLLETPADEAAKLALDEKLCGVTAKDADPSIMEDMEDDPENPGKKRKKANPGPGAAGSPGGALASDEQIQLAVDAKLQAGGYITKAEAETLANDAAAKARKDINELHAAREAVKPLVGVVAMDSAEAVYKFALEKEGVALDGVPPAAYGALVRERVAAKAGGPAPVKTAAQIAAEGAGAAALAIPGIGRFQVG